MIWSGMLDRRDFVRRLLRRSRRSSGRLRPGLGDLGCGRRRRSCAQFLSLGRHGRHRHDRAWARAGASRPPRRRHHRRRRHADGHRQPRHNRRRSSRRISPSWCSTTRRYGETGMQPSHTMPASIWSRWRARAGSRPPARFRASRRPTRSAPCCTRAKAQSSSSRVSSRRGAARAAAARRPRDQTAIYRGFAFRLIRKARRGGAPEFGRKHGRGPTSM